MSQLMPDDATAARRRYRQGYGGEASQAEQQAGLAALISIAQRIDRGGKVAPSAAGQRSRLRVIRPGWSSIPGSAWGVRSADGRSPGG